MVRIAKHHIRYKEVHGVDEVVYLSESEHRKLHCRLRREGRCKLPAERLRKISNNAYRRTKEYRSTFYLFKFYTRLGKNIQLTEEIRFNFKSSTISVSSYFLSKTKLKIPQLIPGDGRPLVVSHEVLPDLLREFAPSLKEHIR